MPIFGVRNLTLNQYMGSVNYNMDKNSIFWVHKSEKILDSIFRVPKTLRLIFRGLERNSGIDPRIKS